MVDEDDGAIPEEESDYPDSGPFCKHWGTPGECEECDEEEREKNKE